MHWNAMKRTKEEETRKCVAREKCPLHSNTHITKLNMPCPTASGPMKPALFSDPQSCAAHINQPAERAEAMLWLVSNYDIYIWTSWGGSVHYKTLLQGVTPGSAASRGCRVWISASEQQWVLTCLTLAHTVRSINIGILTQFSSFWLYTSTTCALTADLQLWGYLHPNRVKGIVTVSICVFYFLKDQK